MTKERFYDQYRSGHLDFHAIEQPLNTNGIGYIEGIHVSIAYRINASFTPMELAHTQPVQSIYGSDIEVCVANCESEDPSEWFIETI